MRTCPSCKRAAWPDTTAGGKVLTGKRTCSQCKAGIALTSPKPDSTDEAEQAGIRVVSIHRFATVAGYGRETLAARQIIDRHRRDIQHHRLAPRLPSNPTDDDRILFTCACCGKATAHLDGREGRLDGNGLMRVEVEEIEPRTGLIQTRTKLIPSAVRGLFCRACIRAYPVRFVGRMEVSKRIRFAAGFSVNAVAVEPKHRAGKRADAPPSYAYLVIDRERDPDPTWAHSGDSSWIHTGISRQHQSFCMCPDCFHVHTEPETRPIGVALARGAADYRLYTYGRHVERRSERLTPVGRLRQLSRILWTIVDSSALVGSRPIPDPRPVCPPMPELPCNWVDPVWTYETTTSGDTVRVRRHIPPCEQPGPAPNPRVTCHHGLPLGQCALCAKMKR